MNTPKKSPGIQPRSAYRFPDYGGCHPDDIDPDPAETEKALNLLLEQDRLDTLKKAQEQDKKTD